MCGLASTNDSPTAAPTPFRGVTTARRCALDSLPKHGCSLSGTGYVQLAPSEGGKFEISVTNSETGFSRVQCPRKDPRLVRTVAAEGHRCTFSETARVA